MEKLLEKVLKDLRVELVDKFDSNFSAGGFFGNRWKSKQDGSASHLVNSGALRQSIQSRVEGDSIVFTSSKPYAIIHNDGGEITVTEKMRKFFWAKAYEAQGKTRTPKGNRSRSKTAEKWNRKAEIYKNLALKKVGSKIVIPQRQYIGYFPELKGIVEGIAKEVISEELKKIINN